MNGWPKIETVGTVTIDSNGRVTVSNFSFKNCSCREAAQLGIAWAMEKLSAALIEDMTEDAPHLSALD